MRRDSTRCEQCETLGFSDDVSFLRSLPVRHEAVALAASLPGEPRFDAGFALWMDAARAVVAVFGGVNAAVYAPGPMCALACSYNMYEHKWMVRAIISGFAHYILDA